MSPNPRHFLAMTPQPPKKAMNEPRLFQQLRRDHAHVLEEIGALEALLFKPGRSKSAAAVGAPERR